MKWTPLQLLELCLGALVLAADTIKEIGSAGKAEVDDGDSVNTSTTADHAVSEALCKFYQESGVPADLYSEELGRVEHNNPEFLIGWDDIDGTENWRRAQGSMPYATIIFVYTGAQPQFKDALVAVIREHISGNTWYAVKGKGCYFQKLGEKAHRCYTSGQTGLDKKTGIRLDLYALRDSGDTDTASCLHERAWVKDAGSSGFHLASVSSGLTDAFVNSACKTHEFGAGILLIKEAGGFVSDWQGNSYNEMLFNFNAKYPVVCAATEELGRKIVKVINPKQSLNIANTMIN